MTSPVPDALRAQRQRAIDEYRIAQAVLDIQPGSRRYPDVIATVVAPLLARARVEGAAEALREAAEELNTSDQAIEIALSGADHVYDHLRTRAAVLSASTITEGDPT